MDMGIAMVSSGLSPNSRMLERIISAVSSSSADGGEDIWPMLKNFKAEEEEEDSEGLSRLK